MQFTRLSIPKRTSGLLAFFCADIPFIAERALFIDDNTQVLDRAKKFGIGHLLSIEQPDLNQPVQSAKGYPQISDFQEVMDV